MTRQTALQAVTLSLLASVVAVNANSNPNNNPNLAPNHQQSYSLTQHASFNPIDESLNVSAETEATAFFDCSNEEQDKQHVVESPPAYVSATISSEALYCSGGDLPFVAMNECSFHHSAAAAPSFYEDYDYEDEESDTDDDDDDDDGHSSMLSNASIRRTLVSVGDVVSANYVSEDGSGSSHKSMVSSMPRANRRSGFFSKNKKSQTTTTTTLSSTLSIRGGSAAAPAVDASTEFARRLLVAAVVTLLYEGALGHLLEFIKIVMQTSPPGTTYTSVLKSITAEKGIAGVWDGFIPWGVVQAVGKGGVFGLAHSMAKKYLQPFIDDGTLPEVVGLTLAGGIAGGFQGYVLSPTLLLKTRVMTNAVFREKMSLLKTTLLSLTIGFDVVKDEGILTLMKGSNVFATKRVFDWSTRYFFSDVFESLFLKYSATGKLTGSEKIAASLLGGTASTISTLPLDVLVAKTQDAKKAGEKVSAWKMFKEELDEVGWGGLYNNYMMGFEARLAHVCFTTVAMKVGTAMAYEYMYGPKE